MRRGHLATGGGGRNGDISSARPDTCLHEPREIRVGEGGPPVDAVEGDRHLRALADRNHGGDPVGHARWREAQQTVARELAPARRPDAPIGRREERGPERDPRGVHRRRRELRLLQSGVHRGAAASRWPRTGRSGHATSAAYADVQGHRASQTPNIMPVPGYVRGVILGDHEGDGHDAVLQMGDDASQTGHVFGGASPPSPGLDEGPLALVDERAHERAHAGERTSRHVASQVREERDALRG